MAAPRLIDEHRLQQVGRQVRQGQCSMLPMRTQAGGGVLDFLPGHLKRVVDGLYEELDAKVFRPIAMAPGAETAAEIASGPGLVSFIELYPALLSVLMPWVSEEPTRLQRLLYAAVEDDPWTKEETISLLGIEACANWAAAQDARLALARLVSGMALDEVEARFGALTAYCLDADMALMLGLFVVRERQRLAPGIAVRFSEEALVNAREAYALASKDLFSENGSPSNHRSP